MIHWREGSRGWLRGRFAAVRCWRVTSDGRRHRGWLIGEREAAGQEKRRKYYWSNFGSRMPLTRMVEYVHRRPWVEQFHEEAKGLLGWDQYQGRLWTGFHRHAVTVMLAYSYLVGGSGRSGKRSVGVVVLADLFPPRLDRRRLPLPEVHRQVVDWLRAEARREWEARSSIAQFRPMLN